jgi:conjugative relaxase-like TrwC/TraI family protein
MKEPGVWAGRGAERLGFRGPVERSQFVALLRNEHPTSGKRLTARMNTSRQENGEPVSNRQVGYGLVFGVPKSLSVYLAITGDRVVENIARSAVDETMHAMETEMQCKVSGKEACTRIAERARCFIQCSSIAILGYGSCKLRI